MDMMRAGLDTYKTDLISCQTELASVKQNSELIKSEYARHMSSCNACKEKLETDKQALQRQLDELSSNPDNNPRLTDAAAKLNSAKQDIKGQNSTLENKDRTIKALKPNIEKLRNVSVPGASSGSSVVDSGDPLTWSEDQQNKVLSRLNAIRLTNPVCQPYMSDSMDYTIIPQSLPIWYPEWYTWCTVGHSAARVTVFWHIFIKSAKYWTKEHIEEVKEFLKDNPPS